MMIFPNLVNWSLSYTSKGNKETQNNMCSQVGKWFARTTSYWARATVENRGERSEEDGLFS